MIREIYCRDDSDSRYDKSKLEEDNKKEVLLNKIRMILYTNRGEILGAPDLGMDLEDNLFDFNIPEDILRNRFYSQLAKYVSETSEYKIDMNLDVVSLDGGITRTANIYITVNDQKLLSLNLS